MSKRRKAFANRLLITGVDSRDHHTRTARQAIENHAPRIDNHTIAVGLASVYVIATLRRGKHVSQIFNWYARDFEQSGGVREFLARFAPARDAAFLSNPDAKIEYETYHWGLNDVSPLGGDYSQRTFYWDWARNGYLWTEIKGWFFGLGRKYGVNPIIFGSIYVGAIPFFSLSVAWLIRNIRRRRSPVLPALCASFCLISAYLYLIIAGKNIPVWVYFFVAGMVGYGAYSTVRTIKNKVHERGT